MKVDNCILTDDIRDVPALAGASERIGFDGLWTLEGAHDPFLRLMLAAEHTRSVDIISAIAVAFSRNPMTVAVTAWDLQEFSNGRFVLGLGTQVKGHIERRFSMPWSHPAPRMREFVRAIRAIWDCWTNDTPLDFHGDFYTHTLMTPVFSPGPNPHGDAWILLAGVGSPMTSVAGEVADGFICHPFSTEAYIRNVSLPAIERGLARSGRTRGDFEICCPTMIVTGRDEQETAAMEARVRQDIAFHGSTPAYRPVLEQHGWGDLQSELYALAKQGEWARMPDLIDGEMLRTFAVVGELHEIADLIRQRLGGLADRVSFYPPEFNAPALWGPIVDDVRAIPGARGAVLGG